MNVYKKQICLIPSAWNSKVLGDIIGYAKFYSSELDVIIISDLYDSDLVENDNISFIKSGSSLADFYIFTSDYIIDSGTLNRSSKITDTQRRISVWHGIPYKKMFVDFDKSSIYAALNYSSSYDTMISSSKYYTNEFLKKAMLFNGEILELGCSRIDSLFLSDKRKIEIKENIGTNKKIVLYAPTFRKTGVINLNFNISKIMAELGNDYVFVTKLHYLNTLNSKNEDLIDLTYYENINEILSVTDILISDYSSLIFDFSVLKKPIILYQYDYEDYVSKRGLMFDMSNFIDEKLICYNVHELVNSFKYINEAEKPKLMEEFYPHEKGKSTEIICKALNLNTDIRLKREVIFLVNDLHQIGGVHNVIEQLGMLFKKKYNSKIIIIGLNEFSVSNESFIKFDESNQFDIKISKQVFGGAVKTIISETKGIIISMQFSVHKALQDLIKTDDVYLMFHGDSKDVVKKSLYTWHLDELNSKTIYNYSKLLFLTKSNCDVIAPYLESDIIDKLDYVENMYDSEFKNTYDENGPLVAVTRLDNDKNIFELIKLFKSNALKTNRQLFVYGDGKLREEFMDEINKNGLEDRIICKGFESNKDTIYLGKSGLIMTPISEGFPMVILEAYSYSIPVFTYGSFTSAYEIVNDSVGKIINSCTIDELVRILNVKFIHNSNCFKKQLNKFSSENIFDKWNKFFEGKNLYRYKHEDSFQSNFVEPLVTIVIPFYNNSDVIESCINSINGQTYKNIESILINDGSYFDESNIISLNPNLRYIYKDNEGLGLTRNLGINLSNGKYVFFLDSDDTLPENAIYDLVTFMEENNLNVTSGLCIRKEFYNQKNESPWYKSIYNTNHVNEKNLRYRLVPDTLSTNKMYNVEFLRSNDLFFEEGLYEDKIFIAKVYSKCENIGIINSHVYNWLTYGENSSITSSITYNNFFERLKRLYEIWTVLDEKSKMAQIHLTINHDFRIYIDKYNNFNLIEKKDMYNEMKKFLKDKSNYVHINYISQIVNRTFYNELINGSFDSFNVIVEFYILSINKPISDKVFSLRKSTIIEYDDYGNIIKTKKTKFNSNNKVTFEKTSIFSEDETCVSQSTFDGTKEIQSNIIVYGKRGTVLSYDKY